MRRVQAFEFHDLPWCPAFVRETIVETLGNALRWGHIYDPVAPIFTEFCERAGVDAVLDLCSGTGEPVAILIDALRRQGIEPPRFALSDLYPNVGRLQGVAADYGDRVEVIDTPVNATAVPRVADRSARSIVSAFHHFPPTIARDMLADCVARRRAVFVLEPTARDLLGTWGMLAPLVAGHLANPFVAPARRMQKFAGTFLLPVLPVATAWDSLVSVARMYGEREYFDLVEGLDADYTWEFRAVNPRPGVRVTVFMGWPRR